MELEYGYTWTRLQSSGSDDADSAVGEVGIGLRVLIPIQPPVTLPADGDDWESEATHFELKPMLGLLLDVSFGVLVLRPPTTSPFVGTEQRWPGT
jgi:hypothetical protein